jgi:hypothetical protein
MNREPEHQDNRARQEEARQVDPVEHLEPFRRMVSETLRRTVAVSHVDGTLRSNCLASANVSREPSRGRGSVSGPGRGSRAQLRTWPTDGWDRGREKEVNGECRGDETHRAKVGRADGEIHTPADAAARVPRITRLLNWERSKSSFMARAYPFCDGVDGRPTPSTFEQRREMTGLLECEACREVPPGRVVVGLHGPSQFGLPEHGPDHVILRPQSSHLAIGIRRRPAVHVGAVPTNVTEYEHIGWLVFRMFGPYAVERHAAGRHVKSSASVAKGLGLP